MELNENNVNEDILLDCDFEYEESEGQHLDVKWYFNGEETFFYQWLSGHKPQLIDSEFGRMFRNHLDLDHVVSGSDDPLKKHRALLLKKPTVALSGVYECKVSTLFSEDRQQKEMKIYCKYLTTKYIASILTTLFHYHLIICVQLYFSSSERSNFSPRTFTKWRSSQYKLYSNGNIPTTSNQTSTWFLVSFTSLTILSNIPQAVM